MEPALFAGLSEAERRELVAASRRRRFGRREVIFHEGDPGDTVHVVVEGHVGLRITTPLGDAALIRVVGPGGFFGELAVMSPEARSATAMALESAETLVVHRDQFRGLIGRDPKAQQVLTVALAAEIRRLSKALVDALYVPADKRLWRRLLELMSSYEAGEDGAVALPLTQEEVAQLAGMTRPTANRLFREAEDAGALALARGRLDLTDRAWIERRARDPGADWVSHHFAWKVSRLLAHNRWTRPLDRLGPLVYLGTYVVVGVLVTWELLGRPAPAGGRAMRDSAARQSVDT